MRIMLVGEEKLLQTVKGVTHRYMSYPKTPSVRIVT